MLPRPRRLDDGPRGGCPRPTKLLMHVTIERSLGPVHVVAAPESAVGDLVKAALEIYSRERRRPLLSSGDPGHFELHYSQFSLESLRPEEKLVNLGSRNFFLCTKPSSSSSTCCDRPKNRMFPVFSLLKLMDLLL